MPAVNMTHCVCENARIWMGGGGVSACVRARARRACVRVAGLLCGCVVGVGVGLDTA